MAGTDITYVPDTLFPTDNDFEVPTLRLDMQAEFVDAPCVLFGEQKRTFNMNGHGVLHFYTDDYRFSTLYEHPEKILQYNPLSMVEPNFSCFEEMAFYQGCCRIGKKRAIARQMQDYGIKTFVDLNVADKFFQVNLLGIPDGWSAFATRGYADRLERLEFEYYTAKHIAGRNRLNFVCIGGGDPCRKKCQQLGVLYVNPVISIKNKAKGNAKKAIEQNIMFFGQEMSVQAMLPANLERLTANQIEDYSNGKTAKSLLEM